MPRRARIDLPNFWYHVVIKGVNGMNIFCDEADKRFFLKILYALLAEYDILLGGFCLMDNHVHLILLRQSISLYKFMHRLLTKYALYFNKKYKRKGPVFDGRYHSFIILKERHLINDVIYVNQNPAKAGMVKYSYEYAYSSARCYYGMEENKYLTKIPNFEGKEGIANYKAAKPEKIVELPIYKDAIGTKEDYKLINKRKEGREKEKYIERRNIKDGEKINKIIHDILIKEMLIDEKTLQMLRSKLKRKNIVELRKKAVNILYNKGFTLSEIARFLNKTLTAIFKIVKKYEKNIK